MHDADGASADAPALTAAEQRYGGPLRFPQRPSPYMVANFVTTIDGVVSLGLHDGTDSSTISARSPADRYVMALLRAAADVIVVGARTLSDSPGHQWTPATLVPDCVDELQEYRRALGGAGSLAPLVVVSASGLLPAHVALTSPAIPTTVLTTNAAAPIARDFPLVNRVVVEGGGRIDGATLTQVLAREFDARLVLTEGGPTLMGALVAGGHVSELFLTVAPRVAGRDADAARPGLVEGFAADPRALQEYALLSVRRREATLLLRYRRR